VKSFIFGLVLLFGTSGIAYPSSHIYDSSWNKPNYPTELIGEFMAFCIGAMNMRVMQDDPTTAIKNPQVVRQTHARVCSCIMDNFRVNQDQAVFEREFKAGTVAEVPNFVNYLRVCGEISNFENMLKHGT
jgi:hypothetical protein